MKTILESLRKLNKVDIKLQTVQKDLERIPKEFSEKEEAVGEGKLNIIRMDEQIFHMKAEADASDLELKVGDEALKKFSNQMGLIRTQREMEAVRRQIETQKMFNSRIEKKTLEMMEETENIAKRLEEAQAIFSEQTKELLTEKARVDKDVGELESEEEILKAERAQLDKDIPAKELELYNRITVNRGVAFAQVTDGYCSACYVKLPPQVHNLAILAKDITTCPSCGRILSAKLDE